MRIEIMIKESHRLSSNPLKDGVMTWIIGTLFFLFALGVAGNWLWRFFQTP